MKSRIAIAAAALSAAVAAHAANPVLDAQLARAKAACPANRARVESELKSAGLARGDVAWYAVPAMSDVMRLMDTFPEDGRLAGELRVVVARDEFEPASFVVFPFADVADVAVSVGPLTGPDGARIASGDVDVRVVKLWLQTGNAWQSYFEDVGLMLVPELMLHDENLVKVDLEKQANYARVKDASGGDSLVWISAPRELCARRFDPVAEGFADPKEMKPVSLRRDEFKQFVVTVHAPKDQRPGVYRGEVSLAASGKTLAKIPVAVRVLPFVLPAAHSYFNADEVFVSSFMGIPGYGRILRRFGGDAAKAKPFYREYLVSLRDHGVTHPWVDQDKESFELLKELGMPTKPVIGAKNFAPWLALNFGGRMSFDNVMTARLASKRCADLYDSLVGHRDILCSYGDEQGAAFVVAHRRFFREYLEKDISMGCAGHEVLMLKGGYLYGNSPVAGPPDNEKSLRPWKEIGGKRNGFYASQHNGSENPEFVRYQHGLLGWLTGFNMNDNYEFAEGPLNDLDSVLYRPMVVSYLTAGGLMEALPYSGYREGVDDIRYGTYLKALAREADASGDVDARIAGRKALHLLALLPRRTMDLNAVRAEMVEHILNIRKALKKQ